MCHFEDFMRMKQEREAAEKEQRMQMKLAEDASFRDPKVDDAKKNNQSDKNSKKRARIMSNLRQALSYHPIRTRCIDGQLSIERLSFVQISDQTKSRYEFHFGLTIKVESCWLIVSLYKNP